MATPDDDPTHTITVDTPPDEVWSVLTDDAELSTWLGDDARLDPVPGGTGEVIDDDGVRRHIRVDEVSEGRSIRWTWWPASDEGDASEVEITLVPLDDGTEVRVRETSPVASLAGDWSNHLFELELELLLRPGLVPIRPWPAALSPSGSPSRASRVAGTSRWSVSC